ncbi:hypothetical protein Plhal703r1_c09g0047251 [Plasmopara halstedii]
MSHKTPSLASSESARGQSPSLSLARGATPDSTSAASREAHPMPSVTGRHTHHTRHGRQISSLRIRKSRLLVEYSLSRMGKREGSGAPTA